MGSAASRENDDSPSVSYHIHHNGAVPFRVTVSEDLIEIFRVNLEENDEGDFEETERELIREVTEFRDVFIGKDPSNSEADGNSILIQIKPKTYMFIGESIYTFSPFDQITDFRSPIGNSDVPYPYAVGEKNIYLLIEQVYVPKSSVPEGTDPYKIYYGMTKRDATVHKKTHGFRVKLIAEAD